MLVLWYRLLRRRSGVAGFTGLRTGPWSHILIPWNGFVTQSEAVEVGSVIWEQARG